jgi:hypothetical protein
MLIANQLYRSKIHGCTKPKRNITKVWYTVAHRW